MSNFMMYFEQDRQRTVSDDIRVPDWRRRVMYVPQVLTKAMKIWMIDLRWSPGSNQNPFISFWRVFSIKSCATVFIANHHILSLYNILYFSMPCYSILHCAILDCTVLHYGTLYYILIFNTMISYLASSLPTYLAFPYLLPSVSPTSRLCPLLLGPQKNWLKRRANTPYEQKVKGLSNLWEVL